MIKILSRYIGKTIVMATGMVALIVTGVLFMMALLAELRSIGVGDYGISQAFLYVFLKLPAQIYQFSPMLILLGSITGLSLLTSYRELAVMRTSGFSIRQVIWSVLCASVLLILSISIVGEWFAPGLSYKAEMHKENAKNGGQAVVTASGVWLHVDNNFIHVQQVVGRELLNGVTRYQFDNKHKLLAAYFAKTLSMKNNQWVMNDVVKTTFFDDRTRSQMIPEADWDLKFNANLLHLGLVEPNEMSLPKLAKFVGYLKQNKLQSTEYQYEFWQRIFQPLASLIMVFLAIPFVLGSLSASTLGWRLMMGVMAGFGFFISNAFLGQLCIVYQLPAMLAAFLPLMVFAGLGALFLSIVVNS